MLDIENVVLKNVSYLHARDPSILSWNRCGLGKVKKNLNKELFDDDSGKSIENETQDHIQVFLRIKDGVYDGTLYQINENNLICKVPEGSHSLRNMKCGESMTKTYSFTKIFGGETKQIEIFNSVVKAKMLGFINGKNCSLLTYGASGSGKTFTIMGTAEEPGLIPRALEYVFRTIPKLKEAPKVMPLPSGDVKILNESIYNAEKLQKSMILNATHVERSVHTRTYKQMQQRLSSELVGQIDDLANVSVSIWVSFAEIYNENIYDLLKAPPPRGKQRPKLRLGNSKGCCYIKDLTSIHVCSGIEAYQILQYGLHNLNYAATSINSHSSRSHCIFTIKLIQANEIENGTYVSTFNFCDLAGSERVKKTLNAGERLKESNNINTSLLVLGRCINNIRSSQQLKDNRLVPFRESKLTQLFQRALTGLEDITMIVNMNPCKEMFDESQHILNFSAIAKEILVEEQPKIIKPKRSNRFSQYMEKRTTSILRIENIEEEDDKDIEINKLKTMVTNLYTEIEHQKAEHEIEQKLEREHIISGYKQIIEDIKKMCEEEKVRAVNKVKREYEEKIQFLNNHYSNLLQDQSDVISIDSSSGEDDDDAYPESPKKIMKDLENTIAERNNKIRSLEQDLCEINIEKEKLQKEIQVIPKLKEQIRILKEEEVDLTTTLCAAEQAYADLQMDLKELEMKNKKLISEKLQLEEKVDHLEELLSHKNDDSDEVENSDVFSEKLQLEEKVDHLEELSHKNDDSDEVENSDVISEKLQLEEKLDHLEELLSHKDDYSDEMKNNDVV